MSRILALQGLQRETATRTYFLSSNASSIFHLHNGHRVASK
jgi:hypothetical protein